MPLASELLCERGYCHASCQWLAMWERLLPCLVSDLLYVRDVTSIRLVRDLLCERGYCHASYQRSCMWNTQVSCGKVTTTINGEVALFCDWFEYWCGTHLLPRSCVNILLLSFWLVMKYNFRELLIYPVPSSRLTACSRIFCPSISWINIYFVFVSNFASCDDASITFFGFSCSNILFIGI